MGQKISSKYSARIIESMEEWSQLADDWNRLLRDSMSNNIFLTFEWLYTWAECFLGADRRLFILALYEKDKMVGLAPWCLHCVRIVGVKARQIEFLGIPEMGSDYMDVIIKRGKEKEVTDSIYSFLCKEKSNLWDSMLLRSCIF